MGTNIPRIYPWLGLLAGYGVVLFFNPIHIALRDGLRCILRFKRIWVTFVLLGFAYSVFQFATFTPVHAMAELDFGQVTAPGSWDWPNFAEVWREVPLPMLEGVAGIFDNATTTYPLSILAAILLLANWRGLHVALVRALGKRYGFWGYLIYCVLLISAMATLLKPIAFWRLPQWGTDATAAKVLQISATIDAVAFVFEYLLGVYIQVYLITVCLAWIKGLSFGEQELLGFAMRRFSYVLEWAGIVVIVSSVIVRGPLLLAYFMNVPDVLDYLPAERFIMCGLILVFCSMQVSLVLHNETLRAAFVAHKEFIRTNLIRVGWFLLIAAIHFFFLITCDAIVRAAIGDRPVGVIGWKIIYVLIRGVMTGWLLASWVCLFRQCETRRASQETWIQGEIQY
ncbi:MAG TPA: hypothetical protein VM940_14690 [Chthoniobacterales bacterium]|jgi:hypothetical protein|nr:hypothetical protein [Chthoniobacterales bacterium]